MAEIIEINQQDFSAVVKPGITRESLNQASQKSYKEPNIIQQKYFTYINYLICRWTEQLTPYLCVNHWIITISIVLWIYMSNINVLPKYWIQDGILKRSWFTVKNLEFSCYNQKRKFILRGTCIVWYRILPNLLSSDFCKSGARVLRILQKWVRARSA